MGPDAYLFVGVDLNTGEHKELHESINPSYVDFAGTEEEKEYAENIPWNKWRGEDYDRWNSVGVTFLSTGHDYGGPYVYLIIARTQVHAWDWEAKIVDPNSLEPSLTEINNLHSVLDEIDYSGPRDIQLILTCDYG